MADNEEIKALENAEEIVSKVASGEMETVQAYDVFIEALTYVVKEGKIQSKQVHEALERIDSLLGGVVNTFEKTIERMERGRGKR